MKKLTRIAVLLLVAGALIFLTGFAMAGFDASAANMETRFVSIGFGGDRGTSGQWQEYTYSPDGVRALDILDIDRDVTLEYSDDGLIHVLCCETENVRYEIREGSTLSIRREGKSVIHFGLFLYTRSEPLRVLIPRSFEPDVVLATTSGDIEVDVDALGDLKVTSTSGDVTVTAKKVDTLNISTTSGDIGLDDITVAGRANIGTTSGSVVLGRVTADRVDIDTTSGDVDFLLLTASEKIDLSAVSGDIAGTLAGSWEDYTLNISTVSGRTASGKGRSGSGPVKVEISTVSGDIWIDMEI